MIRVEPKDMYDLYDNIDVDDLSELNVLHDIVNPSKYVKITNYHYSPILNGYINTHRGRKSLRL